MILVQKNEIKAMLPGVACFIFLVLLTSYGAVGAFF
jgi:hypothetical protein